MNHSVTTYNLEKHGVQVMELLRANGYEDITYGEFNGLGVVAIENDSDKVVGFFWALVGHSTVAYLDYLVTDKNIKNRSGVATDLCMVMLATLEKAGAKKLVASIQHPKVLDVAMLVGFKTFESRLIKGEMSDIGAILRAYNSENVNGVVTNNYN